MNIIKRLNTPFFLTGGTALSRIYFNHRYSDDVDLFVNSENRFQFYVNLILDAIQNSTLYTIDMQTLRKYDNFVQFFVFLKSNSGIKLKIDLVNDVPERSGEIITDKRFGRVDSWQNILSNKLCALFRFEAKDVVDIYTIAKFKLFEWGRILSAAKRKEAGVEPEVIFNIIHSFPINELRTIKWIMEPSVKEIESGLKVIADDIIMGRTNRLCSQ